MGKEIVFGSCTYGEKAEQDLISLEERIQYGTRVPAAGLRDAQQAIEKYLKHALVLQGFSMSASELHTHSLIQLANWLAFLLTVALGLILAY